MKNKKISFCLYGDNIKYYAGAEKNIILSKEYLPDWEVVIYYSPNNFLKDYVNKLSDLGATLINVEDIEESKKITYPMFWRYLIFFEEGISIIRDLDSRISKRESEYIKKWEESGKDYFIIRDHPWQSQVPGGLIGLKLNNKKICDFFNHFITNNGQGWGIDQEMLCKFFEDKDRNEIFYCGFDDHRNYISRDDKSFFIGIQLDENDSPVIPSAQLALEFLTNIKL
jgi:hypothetical protein